MEDLPVNNQPVNRKKQERPLTDEQLLEYLMNDDDSIILGLSDDDESNKIANLSDFLEPGDDNTHDDDDNIEEIIFDSLIEQNITTLT